MESESTATLGTSMTLAAMSQYLVLGEEACNIFAAAEVALLCR